MKDPIIEYDADLIQPGTDLNLTGVGTPNLTATYGDYGGVRELINKKADCSINISYTDVSWTVNNDGSITIVGKIAPVILHRVATGNPSANNQHIVAWFNNKKVFDQTVPTASTGDYNLNVPSQFSVTVPANKTPQRVYPAAVHILNDNASSQSNVPDEFALGILITNLNKPLYRPGMVLDGNNVYQSHNRNSGTAKIFNADVWDWREMTTENGGVGTNNAPFILTENKYVNMRKIGEGQDD